MGSIRTLVVWCPDWPVVAAGFAASVPVAVMASNRVTACSEAARAEGIKRGLRRREAQARCPGLVVQERDPAREAVAFEGVVAAIEALTPGVEVVRAGVVAFGTRGPSRYFGGDQLLATKAIDAANLAVRAMIEHGTGAQDEPGIVLPAPTAPTAPAAPVVRAGVADGPFAAELAARATAPTMPFRIIEPGASPRFLAPLPIGVLERPELVDLLQRLGITTLGALAELPVRSVLGRFGPEGQEAHRLASGLDERPLSKRIPPPDLTVATVFDPPTDRVDSAAFAARSLADELHGRLAQLGLACTRLGIEAETEHGEQLSRLWRHDGALSTAQVIERVRWQLDGWSQSGAVTAGLTLLRLVPDQVKPDHGRQLGFWGTPASDDKAARAMARIQGLLGPTAVVTAVVGGGRSPGQQVRFVSWGEPREPGRAGEAWRTPLSALPSAALSSAALPSASPGARSVVRPGTRRGARQSSEIPPWPGRLPSPSPAVVHPIPLVVQVLDADNVSVSVNGRGVLSGYPTSVVIGRGRPLEVRAWAGPWPIEERWWDDEARRHARIQICLEDGSAHLIALETSWYLEASYD